MKSLKLALCAFSLVALVGTTVFANTPAAEEHKSTETTTETKKTTKKAKKGKKEATAPAEGAAPAAEEHK